MISLVVTCGVFLLFASGSASNVDVGRHDWVGEYTSIVLEEEGHHDLPNISYYDRTRGNLRFARRMVNGEWRIQVVDRDGDVGLYTSMAMDCEGRPHISYYDATRGALKYASFCWHRGWSTQYVDDGRRGKYTSLAFDHECRPWISYYDEAHGNLMVAFFCPGQERWIIETADAEGDVGLYTSIAFCEGMPHVSYYDATHGRLKFAGRRHTGEWVTWTVDGEDATVGLFTSLAFDNHCRPWISYYDRTHGDLKAAYYIWGEERWVIQTVDSERNVGLYTSIVFCQPEVPWISYYDYTHGDLKFAFMDQGEWHTQTVDREGDVGLWTDMAASRDCRPFISYFYQTDHDLKMAEWRPFHWHVYTVDTGERYYEHPILGRIGPVETASTSLAQNQPNPFSRSTTIPYTLPGSRGAEGQRSNVSSTYQAINLSVYDVAGRLVRTLVDENKEPGSHAVSWDGKDGNGERVSNGVYFLRLSTADVTQTRKAAVLR